MVHSDAEEISAAFFWRKWRRKCRLCCGTPGVRA